MGKYEKRWERMGRQMGNILEVKDLCKTYVIDKRQNNVLRNVSFNVEEGDMVVLWDRPVPENPHCCILCQVWILQQVDRFYLMVRI